jgi:hypothetical protein
VFHYFIQYKLLYNLREIQEKIQDTKWLIRSRISKKVISYHGQEKKDKITSNDLQKITQKTKDRTIGTALSTGDDIRFCERGSSSCFTSDTCRTSDKRYKHHLILKSC